MEPTMSKKKRARRSDSPDSEGEKRRGRPRVEKQDESAADRRRTQIRMAQRAYRQRKESTLDELRKRVSDLTTTIELMNRAFLDCRDQLFTTSLHPDQMRELQVVSLEFESYVKDARNPQEEVEPSTATALPRRELNTSASEFQASPSQVESFHEAMNVDSWLDPGALVNASKLKATKKDCAMGYQLSYPELESYMHTVEPPFRLPNSKDVIPYQKSAAFDAFDASVEMLNDPIIFPLSQQIDPPRTYSFQESTFARRLFRAAIERGYQLLLNPHKMPSEYDRVFKLSLMGRDRAKILACLKIGLDKGPHEELDTWAAPLVHIGGAGTHYRRHDPFGNLLPLKKSNYIGIVGPQTLALLENAARDHLSTEMTVEIAGFEGEWFDPFDVQGYLEEKGIFIDPSSSFADAELSELSSSPSSLSSSSSSLQPQTPFDNPANTRVSDIFTDGQMERLNVVNDDLVQWNDFTAPELGDVGFSDATMGSWMNFLQPGEGIKEFNPTGSLDQSMPWNDVTVGSLRAPSLAQPLSNTQLPPLRKRNVIIDVAKFIDVLVVSGVCLGRSPGFRRKDVDRALTIASFDSF